MEKLLQMLLEEVWKRDKKSPFLALILIMEELNYRATTIILYDEKEESENKA